MTDHVIVNKIKSLYKESELLNYNENTSDFTQKQDYSSASSEMAV
ncbi:3943_t:CDS:1, partial [Dentiscutata heterogama]